MYKEVEHAALSDECHLVLSTYDMCLSSIMTGEYVGLLLDYVLSNQAAGLGLVPVGNSLFEFSHELFVINGKNTRLNSVLRHLIKSLVTLFSKLKSE